MAVMARPLHVARNVAIIAVLALVVDLAPGGGNAATAILTAITIIFLGLIAYSVFLAYRQNQLAWLALSERQRNAVVISLGVLAFALAGFDEMLSTGLGTLAWAALVAASAVALWRTFIDSRSY
jgi:hypothetical protein